MTKKAEAFFKRHMFAASLLIALDRGYALLHTL